MTNRQAYNIGIESLKKASVPEASTDAFLLLEHATGMTRAKFLLDGDKEISEEAFLKYSECLERRKKREPCQYIIGSTEFMGLKFKVNPSVLIPRQDTEILAETAIEILNSNYKDCSIKALDLCTGSGCLAVSLKYYVKNADVSASDISGNALNVAELNAEINKTEINFIQSDMFKNVYGTFDLIVSNPPYVAEEEYETLMPEVKNFEPKTALTADNGGLEFYEIITKEAFRHLNPHGWLAVEIGCGQGEAVYNMFTDAGFADVKVKNDLAGLNRVVVGRRI